MTTKPEQGVVVLGYGPQPIEFISKSNKVCGKGAIACPDTARMAGANLAFGTPEALAYLQAQLAAGAIEAQTAAAKGQSAAAVAWLANGSRGVSSNTMFTHLTGFNAMDGSDKSHPHDPDDLDRCLRLLAAVPELREKLPKMRTCSKKWAALVDNWNLIETCHLDEVGLGWTKARSAPVTYKLMRSVFDAVKSA